MSEQNARYFKRRQRRTRGVGGQLSESDEPDGDEPDDPGDNGDGPPGGGPPGGGPPGGGPPRIKLIVGVPRRLHDKHLRRPRAFLDWQRSGDRRRDPPDGPTPATPAARKKAIPASAEVEPKKPRREARGGPERAQATEGVAFGSHRVLLSGVGGGSDGGSQPDGNQTGSFTCVPRVTGKAGSFACVPQSTSRSGSSACVPQSGKPQRGAKKAQWDVDDSRTGSAPALQGGGKGGDASFQPPKKFKTDERAKTANKRPSTTEGASKRPRRVATPATAKRSTPSAPLTSEETNKRLRAHGVLAKASAWKTVTAKPDLVRKAPLHGRPPDGRDKRARLHQGSSDLQKRDEGTAPLTSTALPS